MESLLCMLTLLRLKKRHKPVCQKAQKNSYSNSWFMLNKHLPRISSFLHLRAHVSSLLTTKDGREVSKEAKESHSSTKALTIGPNLWQLRETAFSTWIKQLKWMDQLLWLSHLCTTLRVTKTSWRPMLISKIKETDSRIGSCLSNLVGMRLLWRGTWAKTLKLALVWSI